MSAVSQALRAGAPTVTSTYDAPLKCLRLVAPPLRAVRDTTVFSVDSAKVRP